MSGASSRRKLAPGRLVLASHNKGKLAEISTLLQPYGLETVSAADLGLPEPEEDGDSFIANAEIKARFVAQETGLVALADDSGLCVDALDQAPGIYSARWAGEPRDFDKAMARIHDLVEEKGSDASKKAHFVCAMSLCWPDGHVENFEGHVWGNLVWPPRGARGFGYDPIFVAEGQNQSFAEMGADAKRAISHRTAAFRQLIEGCLA
ncbi:MAG: RdgB/HAM1 family non-canonical purine NTP pyrophosphatase [Zymomonas mobilis subsp. pomaceae]|uniref:RdgB/HAM1 family non-canonical purine NTP pyrophosphatase n=1 Tax=Zymomonas mobilis TaxID=542 RepID=UPI0039EBA8B3